MFLAFCDYMRRESVLGGLLAVLVIYILFVGVPLIRFETQGKVIEMSGIDEKIYSQVELLLPAVEEEGQGTMAWLRVEIHEGRGKTLLEIDNILFWDDTQESIRRARLVAEEITGIDTSNYDIVYSINANASRIEGPSAGPAMAIATSLALENRTANKSVIITGYLKEDGKLGKVSGILTKAEVAKQNGVKLFIVPSGQRIQTKLETKKECEHDIFTTFCKTKTISKEVDVQEEVGIDVIEVDDISEALKYFITE